jgi:dTDP-4-amino-4,6-dideoxy-D-galactose acyltransferase
MPTPLCQFLEWDTEFFGFRIARVLANRLTADDLPPMLDWCAAQQIRCLYLLASSNDLDTARIAAEQRFRFVDIRTTLGCSLNKPVPEMAKPVLEVAFQIRTARPEDIGPLAAIARYSHTDSRFYSDPDFPRERCAQLYETWFEKSFRGYAKTILVAERDSTPVGYITCDWSGDTGQIGLIAVAECSRGMGIGEALVHSSLKAFQDQGLKQAIVVTQGRNLAAQRMYQRCGFLTGSVELWYHAWFPQQPGLVRAA